MKRIQLILLVALFGFLLLFPGIPVIVASDDDSDGIDDSLEHVNERDLELEMQSSEVKIHSTLRNAATQNEIEFTIKAESDGLKFELSYTTEANDSEFELEFSVQFRALIEFFDVDGNGVYNESVDIPLQTVDLDSFNDIEHTASGIANDTTLHYFNISTTDGVFIAHVYVAEEFALVNDTIVTPVETKIALEINFNYSNSSSLLALYVKMEAESGYEDETQTHDELEGHTSNEEGVATFSNSTEGFFSWEQTALVDDSPEPVKRSLRDDDSGAEKIYLNYVNGTHIFHDPKIGIGLPIMPPGGGIPFVNIPVVLVLISILTAAIWLNKKRLTPTI